MRQIFIVICFWMSCCYVEGCRQSVLKEGGWKVRITVPMRDSTEADFIKEFEVFYVNEWRWYREEHSFDSVVQGKIIFSENRMREFVFRKGDSLGLHMEKGRVKEWGNVKAFMTHFDYDAFFSRIRKEGKRLGEQKEGREKVETNVLSTPEGRVDTCRLYSRKNCRSWPYAMEGRYGNSGWNVYRIEVTNPAWDGVGRRVIVFEAASMPLPGCAIKPYIRLYEEAGRMGTQPSNTGGER